MTFERRTTKSNPSSSRAFSSCAATSSIIAIIKDIALAVSSFVYVIISAVRLCIISVNAHVMVVMSVLGLKIIRIIFPGKQGSQVSDRSTSCPM